MTWCAGHSRSACTTVFVEKRHGLEPSCTNCVVGQSHGPLCNSGLGCHVNQLVTFVDGQVSCGHSWPAVASQFSKSITVGQLSSIVPHIMVWGFCFCFFGLHSRPVRPPARPPVRPPARPDPARTKPCTPPPADQRTPTNSHQPMRTNELADQSTPTNSHQPTCTKQCTPTNAR